MLDKPLRDGEKGSLHSGAEWETVFPPSYQGAEDQFRGLGNPGYDDTYLAFLENSPFLDSGTKVDERGSQHVILGYAGGAQ